MKIFFQVLGLIILGYSCNNVKTDSDEIVLGGSVFGTSYSIRYFDTKGVNYQEELDSLFAEVNNSLSTYIQSSDISKINKGDSTVMVKAMFRDVFMISKEVYENTDGYFDPTVGILVNAWGFGPEGKIDMDSVRVDSLMEYVGFDKVFLTDSNKVRKQNKHIYFDFNAIAKGYAVDQVAALLSEKGIDNFIIEIGGELSASGRNVLKNKDWIVGIDNPENLDRREIKAKIKLRNKALASSGNYRKFRVDSMTGAKFVHSVDPKIGYTKNSSTLAVSVLADNCAMADAYATAMMIMDLGDAISLLAQKHYLDAYIIYVDDEGNIKEYLTEGFKSIIIE